MQQPLASTSAHAADLRWSTRACFPCTTSVGGCGPKLCNHGVKEKKKERANVVVIINLEPWVKGPGSVKLMQIAAVSSLSSRGVTDDANNEHFIFRRTASSCTTEMEHVGRDELPRRDLSWRANRKKYKWTISKFSLN